VSVYSFTSEADFASLGLKINSFGTQRMWLQNTAMCSLTSLHRIRNVNCSCNETVQAIWLNHRSRNDDSQSYATVLWKQCATRNKTSHCVTYMPEENPSRMNCSTDSSWPCARMSVHWEDLFEYEDVEWTVATWCREMSNTHAPTGLLRPMSQMHWTKSKRKVICWFHEVRNLRSAPEKRMQISWPVRPIFDGTDLTTFRNHVRTFSGQA
jgi:hypothetical protein